MFTELNAYVMNDYANITQITLLVRRLDIGTKVIRVRQHSQENQLFKYRKDLSYPPKEKLSWQGLIWMDNLCFMVLFFHTSV